MNKTVEKSIRQKLEEIRKITTKLRSDLLLVGARKPCEEIENLVHSIDVELAELCLDDWPSGRGGSHPDWDSGAKKNS